MRVSLVGIAEAQTFGDAMRELDGKGLVAEDFILVTGDLVSSIDLRIPFQRHQETRQRDKAAIQTMVLQEVDPSSPLHPTRALDSEGIYIIDANTQSCLHYEPNRPFPRQNSINFDRELLDGHDHVQVRNDLVDCQIDICSLEVPALWTENFDYQTQRDHFLYGILTSDLLGKTCYAHIIPRNQGYGARARDPRLMQVIAQDIVRRHVFPLATPEDILSDKCILHRGHTYIHPGSTIGRGVHLGQGVMIGDGVVIEEGVSLVQSIIGPGCFIGKCVGEEEGALLYHSH